MGLGPVVSSGPVSANVLANTADVSDYIQGADGDDIGPAINRLCRLAEDTDSKISVIKLNRGNYTLETPIDLPMSTASGLPRFIDLDFRGCVFDASGITAFRRTPSDNTNANAVIVKLVPRISGCEVQNADVAFDIGGCYGARLDDCAATICGTGFRGTFLLNCEFHNCYATACTDYGFHLRSANGVWSGASVSNSSSNVTRLVACRSWMNDMDGIQFAIEGSDSVLLDGCISEGNLCKHDIFFDAQGSTVVKQFYIKHHHFECGNSDTLMRLICRDQVCVVDGVDRGALPARMMNTVDSISTRFVIQNWHYMDGWDRTTWTSGSYAAGTRRKYNGRQYTALTSVTAADTPGVSANWRDDGLFGAFGQGNGSNHYYFATYKADPPLTPTAWDTGILPQNLYCHYFDSNRYQSVASYGYRISHINAGRIILDNAGVAGTGIIDILSDSEINLTTTSPSKVKTNVGIDVNGTELDVP